MNDPKEVEEFLKLIGGTEEERQKKREREQEFLEFHANELKRKKLEEGFYQTFKWQQLRYETLRRYGFKCMACNQEGVALHVDHIKPRSKYPELELDPENLQVLCKDCNLGKSNIYEDNFKNEITKNQDGNKRFDTSLPLFPESILHGIDRTNRGKVWERISFFLKKEISKAESAGDSLKTAAVIKMYLEAQRDLSQGRFNWDEFQRKIVDI